jgi:hypothetical protein
MKLHLTLLTFILISINSVFSQNNNLQFNRAIFDSVSITDPVTTYPKTFVGNLIVPTGKVWKIESSFNARKCTNLTNPGYFQVGYSPENWINNFSLTGATIYPIWLPAGTYKVFTMDQTPGPPSTCLFSTIISGIEFNLVP